MKPILWRSIAATFLLICASTASAQLFENLQALVGERYAVGNRDGIPTNATSKLWAQRI